jgi:2-polyprenyl-3-methyl-5-hydroxy-6-metoxy-1,4-benzoquinol methylase
MTEAAEKRIPLSEQHWPDDGLEAVASCPICGASERNLLHRGLSDRVFFVAPGEWALWRCQHCQSAYLDPRPTRETIGQAYEHYFTHEEVSAPPRPPRNGFERLRARLANGYRNARYGGNLQPASGLGAWFGEIPPLGWPVDSRYRYLPRRPGRVLDVGAGGGHWLELAAEGGWSVAGAEPDPVARERMTSRGMPARPSAEAWFDEAGTFDVVTMNHVIEHVHDPKQLLAAAFRLLKPGGRLYVETPNVDALGHKIYGRDWIALDPPRHLLLFNRTSLRNAVRAAGFRSIRYRGRPTPLPETSWQSRRIAASLDPFGDTGSPRLPPPTPTQKLRSALALSRAEFLTLTAAKPR